MELMAGIDCAGDGAAKAAAACSSAASGCAGRAAAAPLDSDGCAATDGVPALWAGLPAAAKAAAWPAAAAATTGGAIGEAAAAAAAGLLAPAGPKRLGPCGVPPAAAAFPRRTSGGRRKTPSSVAAGLPPAGGEPATAAGGGSGGISALAPSGAGATRGAGSDCTVRTRVRPTARAELPSATGCDGEGIAPLALPAGRLPRGPSAVRQRFICACRR